MRQRIYGLCPGYEGLNDPDTLRHDPAWQTAVEPSQPLAASPTRCRLENRAERAAAWALHGIGVDQCIAAFRTPPTGKLSKVQTLWRTSGASGALREEWRQIFRPIPDVITA